MTFPTDDQLKALLLVEVGDDGTVSTQLDTLWDLYSPDAVYTTQDGRYTVQYLKAKAHALFVLMGANRKFFSFSKRDRRLELDQLFKHLKDMRDSVLMEIKETMSALNNQTTVSVDQMDAQSLADFEPAFAGQRDPNDTAYTGNPVRTVWPVQRT